MRPLTVDEIRAPRQYEPVRTAARRQLMEQKRPRRIALGDQVTLVFENRGTVRGVIEELLRAERIEDPGRIADEVATFNRLIPAAAELSATFFLEITDTAELARRLIELRGIEEHVHLEVGGVRTRQTFEAGRSPEDRTSCVHYLRFHLTEQQLAAVRSGADVVLIVDHPACQARTVLDESQRRALAADVQEF